MSELAHSGLEGAAVDEVIATLQAAYIRLVIDVRALPISRRKGFGKPALSAALADAGIGYLHLKALGTPKAGRDAARSGDRETFSRIFAAQMASAEAVADLARAAELVKAERACLLCFERDPAQCHRSIVADAIAERSEEHTSELQSLMRSSYAVFCLK